MNKNCFEKIDQIPLNKEIEVFISDIKWGRHSNLIIKCIYQQIEFCFSVFFDKNYTSEDGRYSFKNVKEKIILAVFKKTKNNFLKCITAKNI